MLLFIEIIYFDLLFYVSLRNFFEFYMRDILEIRVFGILGVMGIFKVGLYFRLWDKY